MGRSPCSASAAVASPTLTPSLFPFQGWRRRSPATHQPYTEEEGEEEEEEEEEGAASRSLVVVDGMQWWGVGPDGCCDEHTLILLGKTVYRNVGPLCYEQRFEKNLSVTHPPRISKAGNKERSSTLVRWTVDLPRMGMSVPLSPDTLELLKVRAYDAAACTAARLSVVVNGVKVPFKCLKDYAAAMGGHVLARETVSATDAPSQLDVCVVTPPDGSAPDCVGFVNGVRCSLGTHVDVVTKRLAEVVTDIVSKRLKRHVAVRPQQVKDRFTLVIAATVVNPSFSSQCKDKLDVRADRLGVAFTCSSRTALAIERSRCVDELCDAATLQDERSVGRSVKVDRVRTGAIPKYQRALKLHSKLPCSLYLTEGDSALGLAVAGISVIGRDSNGVYPLRGKLVNVRNLSVKRALEHKEVKHLVQILGINPHTTYTRELALALPYRHLVIFTDQDHDGSHIMGLVLCMLVTFFPTLLRALPDFVHRFATPIIRARVRNDAASFFSLVEYRRWLGARVPTAVKYFKGLGTSTPQDAKMYFRNIASHRKEITFTGSGCEDAIGAFFCTNRTDDRKRALLAVDPASYVDYGGGTPTSFRAFCFDELVHFGIADNTRSLPNVIDGLKPSLRKVLHTALKVCGSDEMKVGQLASLTSAKTAYHHGEASLVQTIVAMAQPWVGANNVALLRDSGMFGSRHLPRTEHSAERYIFTAARAVARAFFPQDDDPVLDMATDDGKLVEPKMFSPVVAWLLINGSDGIGTGWKSSCPAYSPEDVIANTRRLVLDQEAELLPMTPSYSSFSGDVVANAPEYTFVGRYTVLTDTSIQISELPPKQWTSNYIEWVRKTLVGDTPQHFVVEVTDRSSHDRVDLLLRTKGDAGLRQRDLVKDLKLSVTVNTNHLNMFDAAGVLRKYATVHDVLREHAVARKATYKRRLEHQLQKARHEQLIAESRARFVRAIASGAVRPSEHTRASLRQWLAQEGYYEHAQFEYLQIGLFSLTLDTACELDHAAERLLADTKLIETATVEEVWNADLDALEHALADYRREVSVDDARVGDSGKRCREPLKAGARTSKKKQ